MAFNKKDSGQSNPQVSTSLDTFFSTDSAEDWQMVKVGIYGDLISFNFNKGRKGNPNKSSQHISLDYETVCAMLTYFIEPLIKQRVSKFRNGEEYPVGVWMNYTLSFTDKESNQVRTIGSIVLKSEINPTDQKNTVYFCYTNGSDEWKIALGTGNLVSRMTMNSPLEAEGFDPNDSRFQQFAYLLRSVTSNWMVAKMLNHQTGIMMNNFNAIKTKLGIESNGPRFNNGGKGNVKYTNSNYRSNTPSAPADDAAADTDIFDAGGLDSQLPY